ncbi:MAG: DDE-type integrase/transposase/recombinase, partial [Streptosporangiaceae bacterium]
MSQPAGPWEADDSVTGFPSTYSGWAYLATVIDGYSRKVVGWCVADHMREELVIGALAMA